MIFRFSGMGAGITSGFTSAAGHLINAQATSTLPGKVDPTGFAIIAAQVAAKSAPPDPTGWYNTAAGVPAAPPTILGLAPKTAIGVGLGLAAVVGLVILRRRAA